MLELGNEHGFYVGSDGSFIAHAGDVEIGDLLKAESRGDTGAYPFKARYSTSDKDREAEVVIQKGLNFEPFCEHGEFNWNHIAHATVGLPTGKKAWYDDAGWLGTGEIIKAMPIWPGYDTDMVVVQHNQFKKGGYQRGLCCSIEGKVTKRSADGRYVEKADVFNVALTFRPINPNCTVKMLAKAMTRQTSILNGDGFFRSLSTGGISAYRKEDLEGSRDDLRKRLVRHLVKKGHSLDEAEDHVDKFMRNRPALRRA